MDPTKTVTLAPAPEPEPGAVVVWIDPLATVPSHRMQRITPAMLAAEWEAA